MRYDMVVSDFDDTLLGDDGTISPKNLASIRGFVERGGIFILCTGRMLCSIRDWARRIGLTGLLACYQGGMVADIATGEIFRNELMTAEDTVRQLGELEAADLHTQLYWQDTVYVRKRDDTARMYERLSGVTAAETGMPLAEFAKLRGCRAHKLMSVGENAKVAKLMEELQRKYPSLMFMLSKPTFLEVVPPASTKAAGMLYIAERFGISRERIAAIGDSMNDLPMVEAAGLGVAPANALPAVKAAAGVVLPYTNNQDAVSRLIEEYVI